MLQGGAAQNHPRYVFVPRTKLGVCNLVTWAHGQGLRVGCSECRLSCASMFSEDGQVGLGICFWGGVATPREATHYHAVCTAMGDLCLAGQAPGKQASKQSGAARPAPRQRTQSMRAWASGMQDPWAAGCYPAT